MSVVLRVHQPRPELGDERPESTPGAEWDTKTWQRVMDMMRHAVGMTPGVRKGRQGMRNRYYARRGGRDHRHWSTLVTLGLARKAATIADDVDLFSVTRDGCEAIEMPRAAIARACQEFRPDRSSE